MTNSTYDSVVIGAGIIGISTAYFLAKAGQRVCVVEKGTIGGESSGRAAGNIGQSHRPAPDLPIMKRALELWRSLYAEADVDFEFRQQGNLRLMMTDAHAARLTDMARREQATGLEVHILDRAQTRELVPFVPDIYLGSIHCPGDGSAEPFRACLALSRLAARQGVTFREHTEVTGIQVRQGRISAVETTSGLISAPVVVNAANAWAGQIGRMVGIEIPVDVRRSHLLVTERLPQFLGPVLSTDLYGYFRQAVSGNVLIGFPARPQQGFNRRATAEAIANGARRAVWVLPRLEKVSMIRAFTGFTAWTPDNLPLIGALAEPAGFFIAAVFCGLGFSIGPAIGELMADLIVNGHAPFALDAYRPDRFALRASGEDAAAPARAAG
jgi:glycine/D-amino acid oxidase-like deaminating enzyme